MNETTILGKTVHHKAFGEGSISAVTGQILTIVFPVGEKRFPAENLLNSRFFSFADEELAVFLQDMLAHAAQEKAAAATTAEVAKTLVPQVEKKPVKAPAPSRRTACSSTIWLKFEGSSNEDRFTPPHQVEMNGKTWYVLSYTNSKRPSNVQAGDPYFMVEGYPGPDGKAGQFIVGRGHLCAFSEANIAPESWYSSFPWMADRKWYVVIRDYEGLNATVKNCLPLKRVTAHCGSETYVASSGKNRDLYYLDHMHTQKIHMKLTPTAEAFINAEFDKLREQYGSTMYYSDIQTQET